MIKQQSQKYYLLAAWFLVGLVFPTAGFFLVGSSQVNRDLVVVVGCLGVTATYLATLVVLFENVAGLAHHMALVASAFLFSAICLILIFASYISYFGLYLAITLPGYQPMLHENIFDPIYLSATTFTMLGVGDVYPQGFGGKFLIVIESLLGMTHSVAFVALLLIRLSSGDKSKRG
jgi:hypothetical protein